MSGILYVVSTPIGNLGDLTPRAAATFEQADFIAAEDTRVTLKLLNHLDIQKPMVSYHEYNMQQSGQEILKRISAGESCALCSDAGVPAVSDPGELLVANAHEMGLRVVPIPAASAAITALCVSGQITSKFVFEGFISQNRMRRMERLAALKNEERTMIIYEAPHKLVKTLKDLEETFGADRSITLCRELTKLHEEIIKSTISEIRKTYTTKEPRGEIVLVVAGRVPEDESESTVSFEQAVAYACELVSTKHITQSAAAKLAAVYGGDRKSVV